MEIWDSLESNEDGITYISTRSLNQDGLENYFGGLRSLCGDNKMPTCSGFIDHFKRQCCVNLLKPSTGANCEEDLTELLFSELRKMSKSTNTGKQLERFRAFIVIDRYA